MFKLFGFQLDRSIGPMVCEAHAGPYQNISSTFYNGSKTQNK